MKDELLIVLMLFFLCSITLGKGASDYVDAPQIYYFLSGIVQTNSGIPKSGVEVEVNLTDKDTTYITGVYSRSVMTNDSGVFKINISPYSGFETGVRFVVVSGVDTIKTPWTFIDSASRKETLGTFGTNDCYSRKRTVPVSEEYIFPLRIITIQ